MWKGLHHCFNCRSYLVSYIPKDYYSVQIVSILKLKPSDVIRNLNVRHSSSSSKGSDIKVKPFSISKQQPPSSYTINSERKDNKQKIEITPGQWVLLIIPLSAFALGTWQVKRRNWKLDLIEKLNSKTNAPPIDFPDDLSELGELEYRKIRVKGKFDYSHELYLGPCSLVQKGEAVSSDSNKRNVPIKTIGHCVVTPFVLSDSGKRILINRGWVATSSINPRENVGGQVNDEVELVGVVRLQEERKTFMMDNRPHLRKFYYRDVKTMAKKCETLPVLLDATEDSTIPGGPIGGQTVISIRNEHGSYIVTWYSLALITTGLWIKQFVLRK